MSYYITVGLTGGIGSGKTTVAKIFSALGIPVYYADDAAKWLLQHDPELKSKVAAAFGKEIYYDDGSLDRKLLAKRVFADPAALKQLESMVHPAVFAHGKAWAERQTDCPYVIKEAALTFESGSYKTLDKVITVFAPLETRLQRTMQRDGATREQVLARMDKQMPEGEKLKRADYVIYNDGQRLLIPQVLEIHRQLCKLAKSG